MPTITKHTKTYKVKNSDRAKERQSLYKLKAWKSLSKWYRMNNPICEVCKKNATEHVHHLKSPFDAGLSEEEKMDRLLDLDNIIAVCVDCHLKLHGITNKQERLTKYSTLPHIDDDIS